MCKSVAIIENAKVRLATAVAVAVFFVTGAIKVSVWIHTDALWKQGCMRDMADLKELAAGRPGERWGRADMRSWARTLRDMNAEVVVPDVPER